MPTFTSLTKVLGLANKCIKFLLLMRLSWLERQISNKFDRDLSLKIDRVRLKLEEINSNPKQENGLLAGVIEAITKKNTNYPAWPPTASTNCCPGGIQNFPAKKRLKEDVEWKS